VFSIDIVQGFYLTRVPSRLLLNFQFKGGVRWLILFNQSLDEFLVGIKLLSRYLDDEGMRL
jgi:hypothetical protein